jgi:uncharacterized membrane protein YjjB (DUF3815 family)
MPYPFAHPAAILPLIGPLGRCAVPSALAIGCMIPDAWYFLPLLERDDSHSLGGLLWFCLPAGLLAYLAFHLLLKQPLLALLPEPTAAKLAAYASPRLPRAPWRAVLLCLLIGACTHVVWDAISHASRVLQHGSTVVGTAVVAGWIWRRLERIPARALPRVLVLSPALRRSTLALLVLLSIGWAGWGAATETIALAADAAGLRGALRSAGLAAMQGLGLSTIGYAILWRLLR